MKENSDLLKLGQLEFLVMDEADRLVSIVINIVNAKFIYCSSKDSRVYKEE